MIKYNLTEEDRINLSKCLKLIYSPDKECEALGISLFKTMFEENVRFPDWPSMSFIDINNPPECTYRDWMFYSRIIETTLKFGYLYKDDPVP